MNAYCSYWTPEYQAIKNSVMYAKPTIVPVRRMTMFIFSRWPIVIRFSRLYTRLAITISVTTIAKPEKMAPATKYGGKIVVCQPGITDMAKSNETTECTERTS